MFKEAINEDLGATAVWGSQQANLFPGALYDGVFGMWYGKAPGVDRTGDVFKHANFAGVMPKGGVLAVAGDDHSCKSSTLPSQSEYAFQDFEMPVLAPADVQEVLDYGLLGYALSRYSGLWVGLIALADTMDSGATIDIGLDRHRFVIPDHFQLPAGGLGIRLKDQPMDKERRLRLHKLPAALAFAKANGIDRAVLTSARPRLGIAAHGQAWADVMEALACMGIGLPEAADLGVSLYKVGMPWPLEPTGLRAFARGLETLMVVEHKRPLLETQARAALYELPAHAQPRVIGKVDEHGHPLLSELGSLSVAEVALAIADRSAARPAHGAGPRISRPRFRREHGRGHPGCRSGAQAVLLLRLPAQQLDPSARRFPRPGGHRLSLHGDLLRPQHRPHQPDGRGGAELGGGGAVHS